MAVLFLTLICSLFLSGGLWFIAGPRFQLDADDERNGMLNFYVYFAGSVPISFVLIFFGLG